MGYFLFLLRHRVLVQLKIRTTHQFDPAEEEYFTQVSFYIFLSKSPPKSAGNKSKCQTQHKSTAPSPPSARSLSSCKLATSSHHHNCNRSLLSYQYSHLPFSAICNANKTAAKWPTIKLHRSTLQPQPSATIQPRRHGPASTRPKPPRKPLQPQSTYPKI